MAGISPREEEFIAALSDSGLRLFTVSEAAVLLKTSRAIAAKVIHRLAKKRKLLRIEKAKYVLIPPQAWLTGDYTEEGIIIASQLIKPYYLSYWTALSFYGWTEQSAGIIYIAACKNKVAIELKGVTFKFVKLRPERFFGFEEHWVGSQKVVVADKEKAIIDCLDQPRYCGEIVEVAKGLWNGRKDLSNRRLLDYALQMKNGAIIKRLGFLMDVLGTLQPTFRRELQKNVTPNLTLLDTSVAGANGSVNRDWNIRVNVDPDNLVEWRRY